MFHTPAHKQPSVNARSPLASGEISFSDGTYTVTIQRHFVTLAKAGGAEFNVPRGHAWFDRVAEITYTVEAAHLHRELVAAIDPEGVTGYELVNGAKPESVKPLDFSELARLGAEYDAEQDFLDELDAESACPQCDGQGAYLGALGNSKHFRCISCGWTFNS